MKLLLQSEIIMAQQAVVDEARRFLGVRFVHQGRSAHGVDCLGLLMLVAHGLGLKDAMGAPLLVHDRGDYGWQPCTRTLQARLAQALVRVVGAQSADIALFSIQHNPQHVGIISQLPDGRTGLIHAYAPLGRVVEHAFDGPWPRRLHQLYRLPHLARCAEMQGSTYSFFRRF